MSSFDDWSRRVTEHKRQTSRWFLPLKPTTISNTEENKGELMPSKKYPLRNAMAPLVREAKGQPYGREKNQMYGSQVALSIAAVKRRLKKPVKRSQKEIAWALEIAGIGEGPADLSEKMRDYLHSDK